MIEVGLVGPGRVGRVLFSLLPRDKFRLGAVLSKTLTSARRAVREMEVGRPTADPEALASCDAILVAVPDEAISQVAGCLLRARCALTKKVVLHTSGTRDSSELAPLRARGAATGSMHPLYVFQRPVLTLAGVHFVVEGDPAATGTARKLVQAWDGEFQLVKPEQKVHHSIARSMTSDFLTGLMEAAVQQMSAGGFPRRRSLEALCQVLEAALEDYTHSGRSSRPGPLLQRDVETIRRHLETLRHLDPQAAEAYRFAARQTLRHLERHGDDFSFLDEDQGARPRALGAAAGSGKR